MGSVIWGLHFTHSSAGTFFFIVTRKRRPVGFSLPMPAHGRDADGSRRRVPWVLPVPFVLWLCSIFVGLILMAAFEFISFFIGLSEMAICEVGVEMGLKSSRRDDLSDRPYHSQSLLCIEQQGGTPCHHPVLRLLSCYSIWTRHLP